MGRRHQRLREGLAAKGINIHTWHEPVDDVMSVIIASCEYVRNRRYLYGFSCFMIVPIREFQMTNWRATIAARLREIVISDHMGKLPYIGVVEPK